MRNLFSIGVACLSVGNAQLAIAQARARLDTTVPRFAEYIDELAGALGFTPLRAPGGLGRAEREIRIWVGFGIYAPETVVRVIESRGHVRGTRFLWWTGNTAEEEAELDADSLLVSNRELYGHLREYFRCRERQIHGSYEFCEAGRRTNWERVLARMDSVGVMSLPDESALNLGRIGFDGTTMLVEVRDKHHYRTYHYWDPEATAPQPEVRRASALLSIVLDISRPPD
jgi:hypothetical protein